MESPEILLQWRLPLRLTDQRRALRALLATLGMYRTPIVGLTNHYASRHSSPEPEEEWFVAFAEEAHAAAVINRISGHFPGALTRSTTDHILGEDLAWYRGRLQHVTDIAFEVTDDQQSGDYRAFSRALSGMEDPIRVAQDMARPDVYQEILERPLMRAAPNAMARALKSDGLYLDFWTDFVRWPHRNQDSLSPPGHWLWNLGL